MLSSEGQQISILEEILGEKKPARKWYEKYSCLFCWYIKKKYYMENDWSQDIESVCNRSSRKEYKYLIISIKKNRNN
jgi:hypothetical protein